MVVMVFAVILITLNSKTHSWKAVSLVLPTPLVQPMRHNFKSLQFYSKRHKRQINLSSKSILPNWFCFWVHQHRPYPYPPTLRRWPKDHTWIGLVTFRQRIGSLRLTGCLSEISLIPRPLRCTGMQRKVWARIFDYKKPFQNYPRVFTNVWLPLNP